MQRLTLVCILLAVLPWWGCSSLGRTSHEAPEFWIGVPADCPEVLPGEARSLTLILCRAPAVHEDIRLNLESTGGLKIAPSSVLVRAGESSQVNVVVWGAPVATPDDCTVRVHGTSADGASTECAFLVRIGTRRTPQTCLRASQRANLRASPCGRAAGNAADGWRTAEEVSMEQ